MSKITAESFRKAWCVAWAGKQENYKELTNLFGDDEAWTGYMLTAETGKPFLKKVSEQLESAGCHNAFLKEGSRAVKQLYRIDLVLLSNVNNNYPHLLDVVLEHENKTDVEKEMRKLLFLRARLKVLVMYEHKDGFTMSKINKWFRPALEGAKQIFPENDETEYLFIVGEDTGETIEWKWTSGESALEILC